MYIYIYIYIYIYYTHTYTVWFFNALYINFCLSALYSQWLPCTTSTRSRSRSTPLWSQYQWAQPKAARETERTCTQYYTHIQNSGPIHAYFEAAADILLVLAICKILISICVSEVNMLSAMHTFFLKTSFTTFTDTVRVCQLVPCYYFVLLRYYVSE